MQKAEARARESAVREYRTLGEVQSILEWLMQYLHGLIYAASSPDAGARTGPGIPRRQLAAAEGSSLRPEVECARHVPRPEQRRCWRISNEVVRVHGPTWLKGTDE